MSLKTSEKPREPYWIVGVLIIPGAHLIALLALLFYPISSGLSTFTRLYALQAGFGITMGYHRLWSHRAFKAHWIVRAYLAFAGTIGFQGSIQWWTLRHRLHHRYTDTEHDPYDATRGLWYSHMGWLGEDKTYKRIDFLDRSDLRDDYIVQFQHKYWRSLAVIICWGIPTLVGGLVYNDCLGGFLYGGFVSRLIIWHATWSINSLAHFWGSQEFSTEHTSRGNLLLAILTMGEGNHNFHHEYPRDYRNGLFWDTWDPWVIYALSLIGLTYDLVETPESVIKKSIISTKAEDIKKLQKDLIWTDEKTLPTWTKEEFNKHCDNGADMIMIEGYAVDVSEYSKVHPGGSAILKKMVGKDGTKSFYGKLNNHTKSARQIMMDLRVARVGDRRSSSEMLFEKAASDIVSNEDTACSEFGGEGMELEVEETKKTV